MDSPRKQQFIGLWETYFPGAELPIAFYYAEEPGNAEPPDEHHCFLAQLERFTIEMSYIRTRKSTPLHLSR